jgi:hypothetical protein
MKPADLQALLARAAAALETPKDLDAAAVADLVEDLRIAEEGIRQQNKPLWKTVLKVVVLSDDGPLPDDSDLESIGYLITEGGCTGKWEIESSEPISKEQMLKELEAVGTDAGFFFADEDGE